jgi:hypothetical protein
MNGDGFMRASLLFFIGFNSIAIMVTAISISTCAGCVV